MFIVMGCGRGGGGVVRGVIHFQGGGRGLRPSATFKVMGGGEGGSAMFKVMGGGCRPFLKRWEGAKTCSSLWEGGKGW